MVERPRQEDTCSAAYTMIKFNIRYDPQVAKEAIDQTVVESKPGELLTRELSDGSKGPLAEYGCQNLMSSGNWAVHPGLVGSRFA